jgi:hypothetical protein
MKYLTTLNRLKTNLGINKMRPYIDSEDSFYTHYDVDVSKQQKPVNQPVPKQKDYSVITRKILVLFTVVVIIKISILLFWI